MMTQVEQKRPLQLRAHPKEQSAAMLEKAICVLVVDDKSDYATTMARLLKKNGYDSHICVCSKDCMEMVKRLRPQVILLDLAMPGMTGFDIAQKIQENPDFRPACLIAVTGRGEDLDRVQTKLCGFDHHLLKPVDFKHLDAIISAVW